MDGSLPVIREQFVRTLGGGILYDASRLSKPQDELFDRAHWAAKHALEERSGGRGTVALLLAGGQRWVLRHYRRGGFVAKISRDRYVWTGGARTRSFAEWRLLAQLRRLGLPVPAPIAARYVRRGWTYTADLITELLPDAATLAQAIVQPTLPADQWREIGRTIAAFHAHGVHHADLNAHNILLARADEPCARCSVAPPLVYLLDFDRGRIRPRGAWENDVLNRLRRSLEKITRERPNAAFDERAWGWLMEGVMATSES
ncbi:MAG TPA: 3-deoxy-D-manno-octulosonic acid kinase [Steroidobacter sp.]|nr:3-deoxy-D-manno-octulosonic acid kinase [Steroidobacter sp.]